MVHPILEAACTVRATFKSVASANPTFMSTEEKAEALVELAAAEAQLVELRLRVLAAAGDLAATTAAKDAGQWLAHATRNRYEDTRTDHRLAQALDRRYPVLAAALRDGEANLAQTQVIARALDALPGDTPTDLVTRAEETLVGHTASFGPRQLTRLGHRILHVLAPDIAEEAEARRLTAQEAAAHRKTRLTLHRIGDGTTRLCGLLPDTTATRLATYLEAFTNPARTTHDPRPTDDTVLARQEPHDPLARLTYPRRLGEAFCQLLQTLDPTRLPLHAGDATTLIITLTLDQLRTDLATAQIIGASHIPGTDNPTHITAAQARHLACTANLIPTVLGGKSEILDQGRTRRLFTPTQRKALLLRDRHCRAEGCTTPGTWTEAHHWHPWASGGNTNLTDGILLCHHHHTRIHDPAYHTQRLPNGDVRYTRRR